jgi:hypothetical protein
MPKLFSCDPPVPPPGPRPTCHCFNFDGSKHHGLPVLHAEVQDTSCDAWRVVIQKIEVAMARRDTILEPLAGLDGAAATADHHAARWHWAAERSPGIAAVRQSSRSTAG